MKKIAVIGAGEFQLPLIRKAREMGLETHTFAWREGAVGAPESDYFYPVSITEKEKIAAECQKLGVDAVATIASDLATIAVSYVAQTLGLPGNSGECTRISTNKALMRGAFADHGIPVPGFVSAGAGAGPEVFKNLRYPIIVKPSDRSGSRAITKLDGPEGLPEAVRRAAESSFEGRAIAEEYIDGDEYSLEGISFHGRHRFLTATRKATTGTPHFIETGHIEPPGIPEKTYAMICETASRALDALKITTGASHTEFKLTPSGEMRIIEIGARMGGDCIGSHLVPLSTGFDYVRMVIDAALDRQPSFETVSTPVNAVIRFLFTPADRALLDRVRRETPEMLRAVSETEEIGSHPVTDSGSRFGYFIAASAARIPIEALLP